jgi:hypothetical protein
MRDGRGNHCLSLGLMSDMGLMSEFMRGKPTTRMFTSTLTPSTFISELQPNMSQSNFDHYKPEFHTTENAYVLPNEYVINFPLLYCA